MQDKKEFFEIDVFKILKAELRHIWIVVLASVILGYAGTYYASNYIQPYYTSTALMYVDSTSSVSVSDIKVNVSSGTLSNAASLITPYMVILKTRITLNEVIRQADLSYSYEELYGMISGASVQNTPIFSISVTGPDPDEARMIVNTITEVLPQKIRDVIGSCEIQTVDYAVTPTSPVSPDIKKYTMLGGGAGLVLSAGLIALIEILDDSIHGSDELIGSYKLPVLAEIPDLSDKSGAKSYKSYKKYYRKEYGENGKKEA